MTCQDSFHEVAFNISFWTRNISSARILFWRGVPKRYVSAITFYNDSKSRKCEIVNLGPEIDKRVI